jgi:hypothetical protein
MIFVLFLLAILFALGFVVLSVQIALYFFFGKKMTFINFNNGQIGFVNGNKGRIQEWKPVVLKSGKLSKILYCRFIYFTPLNTCELCGKTSTPKKVHYRSNCWGWIEGKEGMLCMSCWNKVSRILHIEENVKQMKKLLNKLKNENKNAK